MKFLIDRCAGSRLAAWLRSAGHDVVDTRDEGPDPGDTEILSRASAEGRVLVTIDTDFGSLIFSGGATHRGVVRLPDVPAAARIALMAQVLERHEADLASGAMVTVRGGRIRVSRRA